MIAAGDSCASIINAALLSEADFHAWNPAVSADCSSGFWAGYSYCTGTAASSSSASSRSVGLSSSTGSAPAPDPTQPNSIVSNCNKFAKAQPGDACAAFAQKNGIQPVQLYTWNAVLQSDGSGCVNSFWAGYDYCVGVIG